MRVGLTLLRGEELPRDEVLGYVRAAEDLGYESLWVPESWGRDAFTQLSYVAACTRRIGLATGIVTAYSRSPALLAQSVASLDDLSEGRFTLGLGVSSPIVIEQWHGVPYGRPLQRTREYIDIVRLVLSGERVNYSGQYFHLRGFRLRFHPRRPAVPIYVAALGPKNLELAGELADGWLGVYTAPRHLEQIRGPLAAGARGAGRDVGQINIAAYVLSCVTEDREVARTITRQHIAYYVGGMGTFYAELMKRYGWGEVTARVQECWRQGDRAGAAALISDEILDELAVVGEPDECRAKLPWLREQGIALPILCPPHGATGEMIERTIRELAPARLG